MVRSIADVLASARDRLADAAPGSPRREAALIVAKSLDLSEAKVFAHPELPVGEAAASRIAGLVERRASGEPFAYLFGEREFWGRPFYVDSRTLIPRPETEHLVEAALRLSPPEGRLVDVGTGSGCIGITLSLERADLRVFATDVSPPALAVADRNRARHRAPLGLVAGDLLTPLRPVHIDVLVANLPYVSESELVQSPIDVRDYEPHRALAGGADGLDVIRRLLAAACGRLAPGAWLLLEIGTAQADAVEALGEEYDLRPAERLTDYAGHDRVIVLGV
ncbi:MAG: peptide chain release factor N(5)-glutamine methyltransferase [Acidobacteriota bacterium]|nr:peptide chain release factor N(5)-glutamine methyltransferase [Acidobacteriota bacterium]